MHELARFREDFVNTLGMPQGGPLTIYRNTVVGGAIDALSDNFPVCRRVLGEDAFTALALEHQADHPPRDPVLARYGAAFPLWCALHECAEELPWLPDLAAVERLWVESLHAADAAPLVPAALHLLPRETLLATRLALHPATRFGWFETPAMPIWLAYQDPACTGCAPDWAASGALFTRPGHVVIGQVLRREAFELLSGLAAGMPLGEASAAVLDHSPAADIAAALGLILSSGALTIDPMIL